MRPQLLELEGFSSFRDRTVVDFTDVDLFVLTGPTGSGKTSLIDALIFALYGKVHRYDDDRLVGAAVTTGMSRAKVSFTFTVNGVRYRAVRLVKLTGANARATTPEARLEQIDDEGETLETLAGSAAEVTTAVTNLLGLNFTEFCRVVVLPQGAFQRFMHATAKERRELLFRLLNLGIVDELAGAAREKNAAAKAAVEVLNDRLADLAHATADAIGDAAARQQELSTLLDKVAAEEADLVEMRESGAELRQAQQTAEGHLKCVSALTTVPSNVGSLSTRVATADQAVADAATKVTEAKGEVAAADKALDGMPLERTLRDFLAAAERAATAATAQVDAVADEDAKATLANEAATAAEKADIARLSARARLDRIRETHLAHTLAKSMEAGDNCPVCFQQVDDAPVHDDPPGMDEAEGALEDAEAAAADAQDKATKATSAHAVAVATVTSCTDTLEREQAAAAEAAAALPDTLTDADGNANDGAVVAALDAREQAEGACRQARSDLAAAEAAHADAVTAREQLDDEANAAWADLGSARDTVVSLSPPTIDRDGPLADAWQALASWATAQKDEVTAAKVKADAAIAQSLKAYSDRAADLRHTVTEQGVYVPDGTSPRDAVVSALATAKGDHERLLGDADRATQAEADLTAARRREDVTASVAKLLDARNFSSWVGNRVLTSLTAAASVILNDLTAGTYSLTVNDKGAFEVIDHANAGEVRSAKTLSGGETFLASLALALALAEHVTSQSAGSTSRLESLLLDEGFGTLDTSTLDAVASAIEALGDQGRMVGIVTHIRELAERSPVRYEVSKGSEGSKVTKVAI